MQNYYFYHGAQFDAFEQILKEKYIYSRKYTCEKFHRCGEIDENMIFTQLMTNEIIDDGKLQEKYFNKLAGFGQITILLDPLILKYKNAKYIDFWSGGLIKYSIELNQTNINDIGKKLHTKLLDFKEIHFYSHEIIFFDKISTKFIIGLILPDYENNIQVICSAICFASDRFSSQNFQSGEEIWSDKYFRCICTLSNGYQMV